MAAAAVAAVYYHSLCSCNSNLPQNYFSPSRWWQAPQTTEQSWRPYLLRLRRGVSHQRSTRLKSNHSEILRDGSESPPDSSIARVLCCCVESGCMDEAFSLFDNVENPDTFLWNVMIVGYTNNGLYNKVVEFYRRMQVFGVRADKFTFPFVIKSCSSSLSYVEGLKIHGRLVKIGLDLDLFICNSLIVMYSKFASVNLAERVFDEMPVRDLVSWNSLTGGYVMNGDGWKSLSCLREMQESLGMKPDRFGIITTLTACCLENCWKQGEEIHCYMLRHGFEWDHMVQTSLLDMYCKCRNMLSAERLFNRMSWRNVVAWNVMMGGYAMNNQPQEALACLIGMQDSNTDPDAVTMVNLLPSCVQLSSLPQVKTIHGAALRKGFLPHLILETALIDVYAKFGELRSAEWLFTQMAERSLVSWNTMINAYVQNGWNVEAVELFCNLYKGLLKPDTYTISSIISAYSELASLRHGRQIHGYAVKSGYSLNTFILNSIIYMYAKCGDLQTSRWVFDSMLCKDVVSWNTIIMGYAIHGYGKIAVDLFYEMQKCGLLPNGSTFVSVLSACSISGLVNEGWMYFNSMQQDYGIDPQIEHYGCMVDLLGRTRKLELAESFIKSMPLVPTARIWGSLLTASRNNNNIELAEVAAEQVIALKHNNTGCYVLLSNMYADVGRWGDVDKVISLMKKEGLQKTIARSTVELNSRTCSFFNGDSSLIETSTIHDVSDILSRRIGEATSIPGTVCRLQEVAEKKANLSCRHSVRLAFCYGLISSTIRSPVLVKKNVRICDNCHHALKLISKISRREIIVGDSRIYHHFRDGLCCCADYW